MYFLIFIHLTYFQGSRALQAGVVNDKLFWPCKRNTNTFVASKENLLTKGFIIGCLEAVGAGDSGDESGSMVPFFLCLRNERFAVAIKQTM